MRLFPHHRHAFLLAGCLVAGCQGPPQPSAVAPSPLLVLQAQEAAWNRGDLDAFMSLGYWRSPELCFFSGGSARRGYEEVLARYRANYQGEGREMGRLSFSEAEVLPVGLDHALVRGRWSLRFNDGAEAGGLFTVLLRRFPDGWRIVHDHTSASG